MQFRRLIAYLSKTLLFVGAPSGPPSNVRVKYRGKYSLNVSWEAPPLHVWNGRLTGYLICYSSGTKESNLACSERINEQWYTINNLQPSTKYFVTVSATTSAGEGPRSVEITTITNAGKYTILILCNYICSFYNASVFGKFLCECECRKRVQNKKEKKVDKKCLKRIERKKDTQKEQRRRLLRKFCTFLEPVNPVTMSFSSLSLSVAKPASYIR